MPKAHFKGLILNLYFMHLTNTFLWSFTWLKTSFGFTTISSTYLLGNYAPYHENSSHGSSLSASNIFQTKWYDNIMETTYNIKQSFQH